MSCNNRCFAIWTCFCASSYASSHYMYLLSTSSHDLAIVFHPPTRDCLPLDRWINCSASETIARIGNCHEFSPANSLFPLPFVFYFAPEATEYIEGEDCRQFDESFATGNILALTLHSLLRRRSLCTKGGFNCQRCMAFFLAPPSLIDSISSLANKIKINSISLILNSVLFFSLFPGVHTR